MIAFIFKSYSQDKKTTFQLSIGPTLSIPKTSELTDTDVDGSPEIKSSINIGGYILPSINYSFNEKLSLDIGLGYYLDRFAIEDKFAAITNKVNRNISQIQVPMHINFHFGSDNSYHFGIGGFTSIVLSAKEKGETITDLNQIDLVDPLDPVFQSNSTVGYKNNIKDNYNTVNFGAFIQLKKFFSLSETKKAFVLVKINQYFNSIKSNDPNADIANYVNFKDEKEPTTINFGFGIEI
nr:PorT family protein [Winogradskyella forsetii]